jgi:hypothetical protein
VASILILICAAFYAWGKRAAGPRIQVTYTAEFHTAEEAIKWEQYQEAKRAEKEREFERAARPVVNWVGAIVIRLLCVAAAFYFLPTRRH